jgi:chromosome segregation ATPase
MQASTIGKKWARVSAGKEETVPLEKKLSAVQAFMDFEKRTDVERHRHLLAATQEWGGWVGPEEAQAMKAKIADLERSWEIEKRDHGQLASTFIDYITSAEQTQVHNRAMSLEILDLRQSLEERDREYSWLLEQERDARRQAEKESGLRAKAEETINNYRLAIDDAQNEVERLKRKTQRTDDWLESRGELEEFYSGVLSNL